MSEFSELDLAVTNLLKIPVVGEWVACSVGANFTPHIITVNSGEVNVNQKTSLMVGLCQDLPFDVVPQSFGFIFS